MSGLIERALSTFVVRTETRDASVPPTTTPAASPGVPPFAPPNAADMSPALAPPRFAARALVFGSARDAVPLAAALAGGLRERERPAGAVLVTWPAPEAPRAALGTPAASRLAASLKLRGVPAVARGRLAWVALGADELELANRVLAALDVPVVLAVSGPRTAATDALLAGQDHVVLVEPPDADPRLSELARAELAERGIPVAVRAPLITPGARATPLAGWGRLRLSA